MVWLELLFLAGTGSAIGIALGGSVTYWFATHGIAFAGAEALFQQWHMPSTLYPQLDRVSALGGPLAIALAIAVAGIVPYLRVRRLRTRVRDEGRMMDRLRLLLPLAWRNLWRNPRRTIITVLVVSVGLWSILIFAVLLKAWSDSSRDTTLKLMTGEGQIHAAGYLDDPTVAHRMAPPAGALARCCDSPAVVAYRAARARQRHRAERIQDPADHAGRRRCPPTNAKLSVIPNDIAQGRYLNGPDDAGIVLGRNLAKRLKTRIGKRVVVMAQDANGKLAERAFQVIGLYAASQQTEDEFAFTGLRAAQAMTGIGDDISEIAFDAQSDDGLPPLLARAEGGRADARHPDLEDAGAAGLCGQHLLQRIHHDVAVGDVRADGHRHRQHAVDGGVRAHARIRPVAGAGHAPAAGALEVALESTLLIGIGVALGIVLAVGSVQAFPDGIDLGFLGRGAELVGAGRVLYPRVDTGDFALYSAIVWVLGVIATLWPARRASKVSPVEAMGRA